MGRGKKILSIKILSILKKILSILAVCVLKYLVFKKKKKVSQILIHNYSSLFKIVDPFLIVKINVNINIHENRMGKRLKQFWFMKQEIDVYDFL